MSYHVNNEGNVGVCRAKKKPCPFGGWNDHYAEKSDAIKGYEDFQKLRAVLSTGKVYDNPVTDQAINSSLTYDGSVPRWLKNLKDDGSKAFGSGFGAEIVDVVSIDGVDYAVVWNNYSMKPNDFYMQKESGYRIASLEYRHMDSGVVEGYVKANFVDDDSLHHSFGDDEFSSFRSYQMRHYVKILDVVDVVDETFGVSYGVFPAPYDENSSAEDRVRAKKALWANVYKAIRKVPDGVDMKMLNYNMENLSEKDAFDDEESLDAGIAYAKEIVDAEHDKFVLSKNVPFVDYSLLEDSLRGKGVGSSLYVYAARMLGKENKVLSGSGIQSDDALGLWKRLAADKRMNVDVVSRRYAVKNLDRTSQHLALDFRNEHVD